VRRGRPHAVLAGVVPPPRGAGTRAAGVPRGGGSRGWSGGALRADRLTLVLVGQLAAVVHQEAAGAGELVGLTGQHPDAQLLAREVGTGELEPLGGLGLVLVDRTRVLLGTARLELLQRVLAELLVGLARCVVVGRHNVLLRPSSSSSGRGSAPVGRSRTRVQRTASRIVPARGRRDCAPSGGTLHTRPGTSVTWPTDPRHTGPNRRIPTTAVARSSQRYVLGGVMAELELVGIHADGEHIVLVDEEGQRHRLLIDDALRAAVRRDRPQLEQIRSEGLRPREIQALVRAGASAEEIAAEAGVPVEQVRRYEGPALAERAHVAQRAQALSIGRDAGSPRLGDLVVDRLASRGVDTITWDARRRGSEPWEVVARFVAGDREREATWQVDLGAGTLTAIDDE